MSDADPDQPWVWTFCGSDIEATLYGPYLDHAAAEHVMVGTNCDHDHKHIELTARQAAASLPRDARFDLTLPIVLAARGGILMAGYPWVSSVVHKDVYHQIHDLWSERCSIG